MINKWKKRVVRDKNGGKDMFMEMLYSIIFFLLPVIGMFIAVIARALHQEKIKREEAMPHIGRKKARPTLGSPLVDDPVMRYQLIESKMQAPLKFNSHKRLFHQRAGP